MPAQDERTRLARWLLPGGTEPDPRFTLANERTFLAWIRTGMALIAGGIAIEGFLSQTLVTPVRTVFVIGLLVLGLLVSIGAGVRWLRVERAMRNQSPLPFPVLVPLLAVGGALAACLVLVIVFTLWH
jgi:putative membrane protein